MKLEVVHTVSTTLATLIEWALCVAVAWVVIRGLEFLRGKR